MNIGYVRMCGSIQLDYTSGTATGLEDRICLIKSLTKLGHKVIIYSPMAKEESNLYSIRIFHGHLSFMNKVRYYPETFEGLNDCGLLIIEVGTTNMMYSTRGKPHIRRMLEVLNEFSGLVIWNQTDVLLPIPFWQMANAKYPWGNKKNGYTNPKYKRKGWTIDSGWGTHDEIFGKGKRNIVVGKSKDFDLFSHIMSRGGRCRYGEFPTLEYDYYPSFIDQTLRSKRFTEVCKHPKRDLVYCGWQKRRKSSFDEFVGKYKYPERVAVYGKWPEKTANQYPNIKWGGFLPHFHQIDKRIHDSLCSIQIGEKITSELKWMTLRPYETITDRSIVLCDESLRIKGDPFIYVKNGKEVNKVVRKLRRMTFKERNKLNEEMMEGIKDRFMENAGKRMIEIYKSHKRI